MNNLNQKINQATVVNTYLPDILTPTSTAQQAFAPSNIALCKYWGKRDVALNLPMNGSLSISLGQLGTTTTIRLADDGIDALTLNGKLVAANNSFAKKVFSFVNLFRRQQHMALMIDTVNTIPTAAGLASSASGFAALTLVLDKFFQLDLPVPILSAFARMGSGSASRSLHHGFVEWHKGEKNDGMDSFAEVVNCDMNYWQDLCIGIVTVSEAEKKINSRDGMNRTVDTSSLYSQWPVQATRDLGELKSAIANNDFQRLAQTSEHNAMSMHATMISAWPPVLYWQPESVAVMHKVWELRNQGVSVYITMDAGPNIKLLFQKNHKNSIVEVFNDMTIVSPFDGG